MTSSQSVDAPCAARNATSACADARARATATTDDRGGTMLFLVAAALLAIVAWMLVCLCRLKREKTRAALLEARIEAEARRRALEEKERAHEAWRARCATATMPGGEVMIAIETRDDDEGEGEGDGAVEIGDGARARDAVTRAATLAEGGDDASPRGDDANV